MEDKQRLENAQRQETILKEKEERLQKVAQEKQELETQLEQVNDRITKIENEGGTQTERQNEIDRLKREKAKTKRDIERERLCKSYKRTTKSDGRRGTP